MRIASVNENDEVNGEGFCVSIFFQGCPHHCLGCFNPETWSFDAGEEIKDEEAFIEHIIYLINRNGIQRNLSLLGGEPLHKNNIDFIKRLTRAVKQKYYDIKIFCWTGYTLEEIEDTSVLHNIDILIDGKFEIEKRDITLKLRGSSNQRVLIKGEDF